jgi:FdhD protein
VSAPSSLAADLADETGLTLVGFSRGNSLNVYTGPDRVAPPHDIADGARPPEQPTVTGAGAAYRIG